MGKNFGIQFKGFEEMAEKLEKLDGGIKQAATNCLEAVPPLVNPSLEADIARHRRTGKTAQSLAKGESVYWEGTVGKIDVGFHISKGGLPSVFLMYGTARHAPANQYGRASGLNGGVTADKKLHDDIFGTAIRRKINEKQKQIMSEAIQRQMGG